MRRLAVVPARNANHAHQHAGLVRLCARKGSCRLLSVDHLRIRHANHVTTVTADSLCGVADDCDSVVVVPKELRLARESSLHVLVDFGAAKKPADVSREETRASSFVHL